MVNTQLLETKIKESGLKKSYIADRLGISRSYLSKKIQGKKEFNVTEAQNLSTLIGVNSAKERERIFFAQKVL